MKIPFLVLLLVLPPIASADYFVTPDKTDSRGLWEGWGCSISWWGKGIGGSAYQDLHADLFFTTKTVPYLDRQLPGLGMNIVRYNIGGGGSGDSQDEQLSPKMVWFKDIDGFWVNPDSRDPNSKSWDWTRDANQRAMLKAAVDRGVNQVEFFSNAPMWWMTDSQSSAGGKLLDARKSDFAYYLAAVVRQAREKWGVPVHYISPFNEPSAYWWTFAKNQEGCIIPKEQQKPIINELTRELVKQRVPDTKITASDENSMDQAIKTWKFFLSGNTSALVAKVNVHGYIGIKPWRDNKVRADLCRTLAGKRLWMSEFCDGEVSGIGLAQTILEDMSHLKPTAWIFWQPVEPDWGWCFVNANFAAGPDMPDRGKPIRIHNKYFVFAQFTRFLTPGSQVIGSSDNNSIVAYNRSRRELTFITANFAAPQAITYDLAAFNCRQPVAEVTRTSADGKARFQQITVPIVDRKFTIQATPNTVYSTVIKDVDC